MTPGPDAQRPSLAPFLLFSTTAILMIKALHAVFLEVPTEVTMGVVQRIFYFHVGSAWVAFVAFAVAGVASAAYLATRNMAWDRRAVSAAEIGVIYCSVVLVTGPIWAKPVWGIWWTWDARLTSTFVLWLIYVAYLMMRSFIDDPSRRAAIAAVLSIIGLLDVPIVYMSIRWWRTQHPSPVIGGGESSGLDRDMWIGLIYMTAALLMLFIYLMYQRLQLEKMRQEVDALRREVLS